MACSLRYSFFLEECLVELNGLSRLHINKPANYSRFGQIKNHNERKNMKEKAIERAKNEGDFAKGNS